MVGGGRLRIVYFGTPAFAVPSLVRLLDSDQPVVALVSQPDRPSGRGQHVQPTPTKRVAVERGVPVLQPDRIKDAGFLQSLAALGPDLGVVAAYGRILPDALLALPRLGMINVHASGGSAMMQAAARAAAEAATAAGRPSPLVIAVTVLTSMDQDALSQTGVTRPLPDHVLMLARMAHDAGMQGVVASPHETAAIRQACGPDFAIVTPGIRGASAGQEKNDQARTMGPGEAVKAGATYIVVGRPIIAAPDPKAAAQAIVKELASA